MLKLLVCILGIFVFGVSLLQLRQQRLSDGFEINRLHGRMSEAQSKLWKQQLRIAEVTTPEAVARRVRSSGGVSALGGAATGTEESGRGGQSGGSEPPARPWLDSRVSPGQ